MWFGGKKEQDSGEDLVILAKALERAILKLLKEKNFQLKVSAASEKKPIIEFMQRMRVDGLDKFTAPSFISAVNYYENEKGLAEEKTLGALVIYIEQNYVADLLGLLRYPGIDGGSALTFGWAIVGRGTLRTSSGRCVWKRPRYLRR